MRTVSVLQDEQVLEMTARQCDVLNIPERYT